MQQLPRRKEAIKAFRIAREKVGISSHRNLEWLLEISNLNLVEMDPNSRVRLCEEVRVFCLLASGENVDERNQVLKIAEPKIIVEPIEWGDIHILQADTKRAIGNILRREVVHLGTTKTHIEFWPIKKKGNRLWSLIHRYQDNRSPFRTHLSRILHELAPNLSHCKAPDCRKMFIKKKPWQEYCAPRCRVRIEMRKLRKKKKC